MSDASTRYVVLDSTTHLRDEEIAKLGCKPFSLARMARKARAGVGFKTEYEVEGSEIRRYYKMINALTFASEGEVLNAWHQLRPAPIRPLQRCYVLREILIESCNQNNLINISPAYYVVSL